MRILAITNIFPNAQVPSFAPYNRVQFGELARRGCELEVLATIPWFPAINRLRRFSPHGEDAGPVPRREVIDELPVYHPRTLYLPKVGLSVAGPLHAASLLPHVARYRGRVDVVLSSYAYPDGWAAVLLSKLLRVPTVVKLHGSDINVVAEHAGARRLMRWVLPRAERIVSVNRQLAAKTVELGVDPARISVVYNGVDATTFRVRDRAEARAELGREQDERLILYVGNVKREKGVVDLLEAFERVAAADERARCVVIGRGAEEAECGVIAARIGGGKVTLAGARPHEEIARWMVASDLVCLPSWAEGTPNVVLEALACGRRVVATNVGGIPDLITSDELGLMVEPRDPMALAEALSRVLSSDYDGASVAREGGRGDWADSGAALLAVLEDAVAGRGQDA